MCWHLPSQQKPTGDPTIFQRLTSSVNLLKKTGPMTWPSRFCHSATTECTGRFFVLDVFGNRSPEGCSLSGDSVGSPRVSKQPWIALRSPKKRFGSVATLCAIFLEHDSSWQNDKKDHEYLTFVFSHRNACIWISRHGSTQKIGNI